MYEKLIAIAEWLEKEANLWSATVNPTLDIIADYHTKAAEVRAMAEEMRGRVVVKAHTYELPAIMHRYARYGARIPIATSRGNTPEEAMAALQRELDKS